MSGVIKIALEAIADNVKVLKKITRKKLLAVVKCNGYGMGAIPVSRKIERDVDWFGVATIDEAVSLRKAGITKPILVLGPSLRPDVKKAIEHRISLTAASSSFIRDIVNAKGLSIHLKVDTGMGRIGIMPEEVSSVMDIIKNSKGIKLEGIFSHLATSESMDRKFAIKQIEIFKQVLAGVPAKLRGITHIANSGGIVNLPESIENFSMVRTGLLLYGVYPSLFLKTFKAIPSLKYALKGIVKILSVRQVPAGTRISYGGTFTCKRDTTIAIAGIGYGDGMNRALSNKFYMKYNEELFPIRGNICMDQTILEVKKDIKEASEVIFLDNQLSIELMAEICGTVPQAIMTAFGASRLKKAYHG
ncbi:MAG TPA: alanine racemase [bacterium]|nr:alanine racemase [bacterium]HOL34386.1 alanine racemase [bacterium]HPP07951.1 alanine racemase [bacterium]